MTRGVVEICIAEGVVYELDYLLFFWLLSYKLFGFLVFYRKILELPILPMSSHPLIRQHTFNHLYFKSLERCNRPDFTIFWFAIADGLFAGLCSRGVAGSVIQSFSADFFLLGVHPFDAFDEQSFGLF